MALAMDILAAGCINPLGLGLGEIAAAARARVARMREIAILDHRLEPFIAASVPDEGLPPLTNALADKPPPAREARMLRLAHAALAEVLAPLPPDTAPIPLLLGLPEQASAQPLDPALFLHRLALQSGAPLDLARSIAVARGRAAGLMALHQAATRLAAGETDYILLGGVDSLLDPYVLNKLDLDHRIRNADNNDAFTPGEGAAFLLLGDPARRGSKHPLATVLAAATGFEPGHLYADDVPYLGEGLAASVSTLFAETPPRPPVACTYASFNGERYWAREFAVTRLRNVAHFTDNMQMEHPAECCGDLGAAHGPFLAALAAHALAGGYRPGPCLVYASSDYGDRAAALLSPS
jgi:3-oxoacyl-[acyl-carrier-protein] synthase-1